MGEHQEPLLEGRDIQGNIIPGFNRSQQYLVAFSCESKDALISALAFLRPLVTTLDIALEYRDDRKRAFLSGAARPPRNDLWLNVALSRRATDLLGALEVKKLDSEFRKGMQASITGDALVNALADGQPNPAYQENWVVGSRKKPADLLLIFAHDKNVEQEADPVVANIVKLLRSEPTYREPAALLPGGIEHFGFRDGISQAGIRGRIKVGHADRYITTRYGVPSRDGIEFGKPGQPLVWPGQFLTGQPEFPGDASDLPPELTNGSFLVFRRLTQDVAVFDRDTEDLALTISTKLGQPLAPDDLRARLVGRYRSGAALMRHEQDPGIAEGPNEINYFAYANSLPPIALSDGSAVSGSAPDIDVLRGRRCPVWSHVRKVNPRDLPTNRGDAPVTLSLQMLRRGIPFGPAYDRSDPHAPDNNKERGLLFLSYQRSIEAQFNALNRDWMNNRDAPSAGGFDLLVGQKIDGAGLHAAKPAIFFTQPASGTDDGIIFEASHQWVTPTGGAFMFAPSLTFIDTFAPSQVA